MFFEIYNRNEPAKVWEVNAWSGFNLRLFKAKFMLFEIDIRNRPVIRHEVVSIYGYLKPNLWLSKGKSMVFEINNWNGRINIYLMNPIYAKFGKYMHEVAQFIVI